MEEVILIIITDGKMYKKMVIMEEDIFTVISQVQARVIFLSLLLNKVLIKSCFLSVEIIQLLLQVNINTC